MKVDLHYDVEKGGKRVLLGMGRGGAGFGRADGLRSSLVVRDVEVGEIPKGADGKVDPDGFKTWQAALEAKYAKQAQPVKG